MNRNFATVTLNHLQATQPWTVPYSAAIDAAVANGTIPHLLGSHVVLHAAKTIGKLASVFEALDHSRDVGEFGKSEPMTEGQLDTIKDMAADLVTEAMRLANLYKFDLAQRLVERSEEKNRVTLTWPGAAGAGAIQFTDRERSYDRVSFAEDLIQQLPETHEGRNTWLLNYGRSQEAISRRTRRGLLFDETTRACYHPAPAEYGRGPTSTSHKATHETNGCSTRPLERA